MRDRVNEDCCPLCKGTGVPKMRKVDVIPLFTREQEAENFLRQCRAAFPFLNWETPLAFDEAGNLVTVLDFDGDAA